MSTRQGTFGAGGNVEFNLIIRSTQTEQDLSKIIVQAEIAERLLTSTLSLLRKMSGGNEDVERFTTLIQRAIMVVTQLRLASNLLMASSPWLWPLGIIGIVGTAVSLQDLAGSYI